MNASDVVETLTIAHWDGPVPAESQRRAEVGLEAGRVLLFPALAFHPAPDEHALLSPDALDNTRKNISLDSSTTPRQTSTRCSRPTRSITRARTSASIHRPGGSVARR